MVLASFTVWIYLKESAHYKLFPELPC